MIIMLSRALTLIGCTATLAACVSQYQEPARNDAATLVFRKAGAFTAQAFIYGGADECTDRYVLPMMKTESELTRKVSPGAPLTFSMFYLHDMGVAETYCVDTLTFLPEAGHRYLATLSAGHGRCLIELEEIRTAITPTASPQPLSVQHHKWKRAMSEHGPWCGS
jgi:hypothetical protein